MKKTTRQPGTVKAPPAYDWWTEMEPTALLPRLITVTTDGRKPCSYYVTPLATDENGVAFWFEKGPGCAGSDPKVKSYDVLIPWEGYPICDCKGFSRFSYCRHTHVAQDMANMELAWRKWQAEAACETCHGRGGPRSLVVDCGDCCPECGR